MCPINDMYISTELSSVDGQPSDKGWVLARGKELGSRERVGQKMARITTKMSLFDIRATEERVLRAERLAKEARKREAEVQQQAKEARQQVQEGRWKVQEAQRQAEKAVQIAQLAEQRIQEEKKQYEMRLVETERHINTLQQQSEVAIQRARQHTEVVQQQAREREEQLQEQIRRAEQRAQVAEQRAAAEKSFWAVGREEIELQEEEEELGRGAWAVVRVAKFRGIYVAAKCLHSMLISQYNQELFVREMNFASKIRHPNLLQFIGATVQGDLIILTELMPTSVRAVMEQRATRHQRLSSAEVTSISLDVACALNYLHLMKPNPIVHRDISSANVLLKPTLHNGWSAKVSDFGSANFLFQLRTLGPGSPVYAAPEANTPLQQSAKMDIFSFGVLLLEMASCRFPDLDSREKHIGLVEQPFLVPLIQQCISVDRDRRPTANDVLNSLHVGALNICSPSTPV